MSQVFAKPYDCLSCGQQIRLSKIDNPNSRKKWLKYEMDGKTEHSCNNNNNNNNNKPEEQEQQQQQQEDLAKELTHLREENKELRALMGLTRQDVRSLVAQVQLLRQELNPEKKEKVGGNGGKK